MHQPVAGVTGIGIALQDAHPKRFELQRLAEADDAIVRRTICLRHTVDLSIGQPFGTRTAIGAQQSQVCAIGMEAPATVVFCRLQPQNRFPPLADTKEHFRQPSQVNAPVLERYRIEVLLTQQRAQVVVILEEYVIS